jgi:hypothetical protein
MAFTYDLSASGDDLAVSKIRLEIGDTDSSTDAGVKPDGTNFTDAELSYFYDDESDSVLAASARACEVLARMYARQAASTRIRDYQIDNRQRAEYFREMAADLRQRSGSSQYAGGSAPMTRIDGYSNDVASTETEEADSGDYDRRTVEITL